MQRLVTPALLHPELMRIIKHRRANEDRLVDNSYTQPLEDFVFKSPWDVSLATFEDVSDCILALLSYLHQREPPARECIERMQSTVQEKGIAVYVGPFRGNNVNSIEMGLVVARRDEGVPIVLWNDTELDDEYDQVDNILKDTLDDEFMLGPWSIDRMCRRLPRPSQYLDEENFQLRPITKLQDRFAIHRRDLLVGRLEDLLQLAFQSDLDDGEDQVRLYQAAMQCTARRIGMEGATEVLAPPLTTAAIGLITQRQVAKHAQARAKAERQVVDLEAQLQGMSIDTAPTAPPAAAAIAAPLAPPATAATTPLAPPATAASVTPTTAATPARSALRWRLGEGDTVSSPAVSEALYDAAVAANSLIVYTESEFAQIESQLQATRASVHREGQRASSLGLEWKLVPSKPNSGRQVETNQLSPAISTGLEAGQLHFTREERDGDGVHCLREYDYVEINSAFYRAMAPTAQKLPVAWHRTDWTSDHLQRELSFRVIDTPSITCVFHPSSDNEDGWYELLHVFVPPGSIDSPELLVASDAFAAAAATRFEVSTGEDGRPHSHRRRPINLRGELNCLERGSKVTEGPLLMYGAHRFHGVSVEGRASEWAQRYNPTGEPAEKSEAHRAAINKTNAHCRALQHLEETLLPEAAETRRQIATTLDPDADFRVIEGDGACTPFSMAMASGYVVECHNDSGYALEGILFYYSSDEPMPEGHEWMFIAAGCMHKLPKTCREGAAYMAVRGSEASHGTLPTSSTMPHLTTHAGVSTTIVTKKLVVDVLKKRQAAGALPFPSQEELAAARRERRVSSMGAMSLDDAAMDTEGAAPTAVALSAASSLPPSQPPPPPSYENPYKLVDLFCCAGMHACRLMHTQLPKTPMHVPT